MRHAFSPVPRDGATRRCVPSFDATSRRTARITGLVPGRVAKRFLEQFVHAGDEVVLSTTKPDKYDRYLADVYVGRSELSAETLKLGDGAADEAEIFLNNALLENGHAVCYDGVGPKAEGGVA